ncbi:MAG: hypothetical protein SGPRY_004601 [Prymnesium sp.]
MAYPQIQVFVRNENATATPLHADSTRANDLTVEYDVFACDAFTEDQGRWVRLMPDADFIPT